MSHYDAALAGEANARPGNDTRQWVSYGTVSPETADAKSTTFTKEYGPLVNVKLHPTGIPVVCRVAHEVAGNGEGEWFPFIEGDEVIVLIPEGDETAGCVIMGRLNQEIDFWPTIVAGQDPRLNNFAFRRMRTPYIFETAGGYLVNSATTGAFFSISDTGTITLSNADKAFLTLTADFLGLQNKTADVLIQIAVEKKQIVLNVPGVSMVLDSLTSHLYTLGTLQIGTSGAQAAWHATSIESVAVLLQSLLIAIGATDPGPLTGTGLAAGAIALVNAALTAAASLPITPLLPGVTGGLAIPSVPGVKPGLAAAALLIG